MTDGRGQLELELRLERVRVLAKLAVAERDGLDQGTGLRVRRAEVEAALAELRSAGGPMRRLAGRLGLTALQVDFLWAAVAATADPRLAVHAEALVGSAARLGKGVNLFARLVELDEAAAWPLPARRCSSSRAAGSLLGWRP